MTRPRLITKLKPAVYLELECGHFEWLMQPFTLTFARMEVLCRACPDSFPRGVVDANDHEHKCSPRSMESWQVLRDYSNHTWELCGYGLSFEVTYCPWCGLKLFQDSIT